MSDDTKGRVVGVGGVFFKVADAAQTRDWYRDHLGLGTDAYGTNFEWRVADEGTAKGFTQWSPFAADTEYFGEPDQKFMVNYRVVNIEALIEKLRSDGVTIAKEIETEDYGKFAHIIDGDGHRVELWEPNDVEYEKIVDGVTK